MSDNPDSTLKAYQPRFRQIDTGGSDPKVDCVWFHHAGGGSNTLAHRVRQSVDRIAAADLPDIRLLTPVTPLREDAIDERFDGELHTLADQYAAILQQDFGIGRLPFVVLGHSFGSVLAYEVTRRLIDAGHSPARLVVMSFPAPDRLTHQTELHTLDNRSLMQQVDELFGGVPPEILDNDETWSHFVPGLRSDLGLLERYRPDLDAAALPVPVTAMVGTDDRAVSLADVQRWDLFTEPPVRLQTLPGDHFFPLQRIAEVFTAAAWDLPEPR
ncbi:thioesterase II family protein [Crateriforma conspicua]|uniref:thioesterase II family protein n=1 Tax=Crateriforma conspicua TaxID=2527996 RepID=UPI001189D331|nr:alpha/beta fold hydrolase [Crateriforma conspicua]QDV60953.1 Surfactin synthase thioesterase subunit [Crateriforma conspicua]